MKLSPDQIRIAKSTTLYAVAIIVLLPIVRHLLGTPLCWGDALVSAGALILGTIIIGMLFIIGSSKPSKGSTKKSVEKLSFRYLVHFCYENAPDTFYVRQQSGARTAFQGRAARRAWL